MANQCQRTPVEVHLYRRCKKGKGSYVESKRSRVGWERFTYTADTGRETKRLHDAPAQREDE